jgi:hypothetical protein
MNENSVEVCVVKKMVGAEGFEPPTPASQTLCSTRLSHAPSTSVVSVTLRIILEV